MKQGEGHSLSHLVHTGYQIQNVSLASKYHKLIKPRRRLSAKRNARGRERECLVSLSSSKKTLMLFTING